MEIPDNYKCANTRREKRINITLPLALPLGRESSWVAPASTVDLSQRGLRLRSNISFRPGQDIQVIVNQGTSDASSYRVAWVRILESGNSRFEVGLVRLSQTNSASAA